MTGIWINGQEVKTRVMISFDENGKIRNIEEVLTDEQLVRYNNIQRNDEI